MKNQLIKGTFILTLAGLLVRILGFFYRIYLSNNIGAMGMGLTQMIMPVYGLCFSISAAGIHTAISKSVAEKNSDSSASPYDSLNVLMCGLKFSLFISLVLMAIVFAFSKPVALYFLGDISCSRLLQIISFAIPLGSIHSCITGYYLGIKKATIPAVSQLLEQAARIMLVIIIINIMISKGLTPDASTAAYGIVIGEAASSLFCLFIISLKKNKKSKNTYPSRELLKTSVPLTLNRVMLSFLGTLEAMLIPLMLKIYGLSHENAVSVFGILTGMAFPFIFFPSTITNAISSMLLPEVAEAKAGNNNSKICKTISRSLRYSLILGIFCTGIFLQYGRDIGLAVFNEPLAGNYIVVLGWLCPFLYLSTTFGSILNGLGMVKNTFFHNIAAVVLRILFIVFLVPNIGITGYLWGILAAEITCSFLHYIALKKICKNISFNAVRAILLPASLITFCGIIGKRTEPSVSSFFKNTMHINPPSAVIILFSAMITSILFLGGEAAVHMLITKIRRK